MISVLLSMSRIISFYFVHNMVYYLRFPLTSKSPFENNSCLVVHDFNIVVEDVYRRIHTRKVGEVAWNETGISLYQSLGCYLDDDIGREWSVTYVHRYQYHSPVINLLTMLYKKCFYPT